MFSKYIFMGTKLWGEQKKLGGIAPEYLLVATGLPRGCRFWELQDQPSALYGRFGVACIF